MNEGGLGYVGRVCKPSNLSAQSKAGDFRKELWL